MANHNLDHAAEHRPEPGRFRVTGLFVYPVKSARGFSPRTWPVDELGFAWDRRWLVARPDGQALTQREEPRLALLVPALSDHLSLSAPAMPALRLPLETPSAPEVGTVEVLGARLEANAVRAADAWLARFLGYPARMFRLQQPRPVNPRYAVAAGDRTAFTDGFPFLLVGEASLADLNARLTTPVQMDRFRPNLVIQGTAPFEEDTWRRVRVGEVDLAVVKPCARCVITTTDQRTGERSPEPLRALSEFRRTPAGKVMFGQNAIHLGRGTIRAGDVVAVMDAASSGSSP